MNDDIKNALLDRDLQEFITKTEFSTQPLAVPDELSFPFLMIFHRSKVSARNNQYLVAVPIRNISDIKIMSRNMAHKGWPTMTLTFDLPEWMLDTLEGATRFVFWKFHTWRDAASVLSERDKYLIPDLEEIYPCPASKVKEKSGQYRLIF